MSRFLFALLLLGGYASGVLAGPVEWEIEPPPSAWRTSAHPLPEELFFEVPVSKASAAILGRLSQNTFNRLDEGTLSYFVGIRFRCSPNYVPYLVRAPFGHGGTGQFTVYLSGNDVIVDHESLGKTSAVSQSALVVCLASEPGRVFNVVGVDE
jgi:hypothetical protein